MNRLSAAALLAARQTLFEVANRSVLFLAQRHLIRVRYRFGTPESESTLRNPPSGSARTKKLDATLGESRTESN